MERYDEVVGQVKSLNEQIQDIEKEIEGLRSGEIYRMFAQIARYEELLVEIDKYLLEIKELQLIAKRNLESQNILTIEAPPGYRVSINRLKRWTTMINPTAANDPFAQRILTVAKCDEMFLERKRKEYLEQLKKLRDEAPSEDEKQKIDARIRELEEKAASLRAEVESFTYSQELIDLGDAIKEEVFAQVKAETEARAAEEARAEAEARAKAEEEARLEAEARAAEEVALKQVEDVAAVEEYEVIEPEVEEMEEAEVIENEVESEEYEVIEPEVEEMEEAEVIENEVESEEYEVIEPEVEEMEEAEVIEDEVESEEYEIIESEVVEIEETEDCGTEMEVADEEPDETEEDVTEKTE